MATRRVTLREAAATLGVSKEAVRKRVLRGTLQGEKDPDGRVYVYLDAITDEPTTHEPGVLISEMKERIAFLERELERKDAILLNMTEAMKALNAPRDEGESLESVSEEPEGEEEPEAAQEPISRRSSWWRRWWPG